MAKQKSKTGVAILNNPPPILENEINYKASLKASIQVGEELAFASLSTELLVLQVSGTPKHKWEPYLGRSQYPKFCVKTLAPMNKPNIKYTDEPIMESCECGNITIKVEALGDEKPLFKAMYLEKEPIYKIPKLK